jgi:hypothetical protein
LSIHFFVSSISQNYLENLCQLSLKRLPEKNFQQAVLKFYHRNLFLEIKLPSCLEKGRLTARTLCQIAKIAHPQPIRCATRSSGWSGRKRKYSPQHTAFLKAIPIQGVAFFIFSYFFIPFLIDKQPLT